MRGRGILGRWGVNHAADTIVTRYRRDESTNVIMERDGKKVLEFLCYKRPDNSWGLPGGFAHAGATSIRDTQEKTFKEKVLGVEGANKEKLAKLFKKNIDIPTIYSHDVRNTDNAWVETTPIHFHDDTGSLTAGLRLRSNAAWLMLHRGLNLFASHEVLLQLVASKHDAYFG